MDAKLVFGYFIVLKMLILENFLKSFHDGRTKLLIDEIKINAKCNKIF